MRLQNNQSTVGANEMLRNNVSFTPVAHEAKANLWGTVGKAFAFGAQVDMETKVQNEKEAAMADANRFSQESTQLMLNLQQEKTLDQAVDIDKAYSEGILKIQENIAKESKGKYALSQDIFSIFAKKNNTENLNNLAVFQAKEHEKYITLETEKAVRNGENNIYAKGATVDNVNSESESVLAMIEMLNGKKNPLVVEELKRNARGQLWSAAVIMALNTDKDFDRAGELLQASKDDIPLDARLKMAAVINARKRDEASIVTIQSGYAKYGNNAEGYINEWRLRKSGDVGAAMGYAASRIGQKLGENQCANFVSDVISKMGGGQYVSPLADGMYLNFEEAGRVYTKGTPKDGDAVFWHVKGSKYAPSGDKAAVQSKTHAYKGITHVGIYDAKTGKVIQSGTKGVAYMDLNHYEVVGYGDMQGLQKPPSALEEMEERKAYNAYANAQQAIKKKQEDFLFDGYENEIYTMFQNNTPYEQVLSWVSVTAGADSKLKSQLTQVVNTHYSTKASRSRSGSTNGLMGEDYSEEIMADLIGVGQFKSKTEARTFASANGANADKANAAARLQGEFDEGKGRYAYNWNEVKADVMGNKTGGANDQLWARLKKVGGAWVSDYIKKHGYEPSHYEVVEYLTKSAKEQRVIARRDNPNASIFNKDAEGKEVLKISDLELEALNIRRFTPLVGNRYRLEFHGGRADTIVTEAQFFDMMKNKEVPNNAGNLLTADERED